VAYLDHSPRVGRSQGVLIFWGLISLVFAALFCFYYWKNHENEATANKLRDEVLTLQDQRDALTSEKEKLQAGLGDAESEMKAREDLLQAKEAKLAEEEARLESLAKTPTNPPTPGAAQSTASVAATSKKFDDLAHKLGADSGAEVITRGGRPVLRVPNPVFFAPGDATLKPDGKTFLNQVAQSVNGQIDTFELRMESFTDSDAEAPKTPDPTKKDAPPGDSKPHYATSWDLTAARAAAIARFYRDQTTLPFQNVVIIARGDAEPVVTGAKDDPARNGRIEISLTPLPAAPHPTEATHTAPAANGKPPLAPPPEPPPPSSNKPKVPQP